MSTQIFNDQWRMPNNKNQSKQANYSLEALSQGDFVTVDDFPFGSSQSFTISFWVYGADLVNPNLTKSFIGTEYYSNSSPSTQFGFALNFNSGKIQFYSSPINGSRINNFYTADNVLIENEWNHIILRYNYGTDYRIYHNNTLKAVYDSNWSGFAQADVEVQYSTQTLWMYRGYYATYNLIGKMAEFSFFGYALTDTATSAGQTPTGQVAAIYGDGSSLPNPMALSPKPIAHYQLGDETADNGANYLVPNSSLKDYVFEIGAYPRLINAGTIADLNSNMAELSVSIWFKKTGGTRTNDYAILSKVGANTPTSFSLFWKRDSLATQGVNTAFKINNGSVQAVGGQSNTGNEVPITIEDNKWYNLVGTYNGTTQSLYINGVLHDFKSTTGNIVGVSGNALLGADSTIASYNWLGELSNSMIWTKGLSQSEVTTLYNYGSPIQTLASIPQNSNLKVWWKLNAQDTFDGTNWTIKDYAGSNDGTSSGMTSANLVQSNLQYTSGYSPYALDFGGISSNLKTYTIPAATNTVTLSAWVKRTGASGDFAGVFGVRNSGGAPGYGICWDLCFLSTTNKIEFRVSETDGSAYIQSTSNVALTDNTWTHVVGVADGTNVKLYINGVLQTDVESYDGTLRAPTSNIFFADQGPAGNLNAFNGQLSNCARWNIGLTQAQVTEIYNQGVPSNLNNFSGTTPIGWWQLGSNSSFEGNDWTCLDEIGNDYADSNSTTMSNDDIVNGVGVTGNGLGASTIDIVGDAPYSEANSISVNIAASDRVNDVPS